MPVFSRDTIINILSIYDNSSHTIFSRLLLRFDLGRIAPRSLEFRSLSDRVNRICEYLFENTEALGPNGRNLTSELIEYYSLYIYYNVL